MFVVSCQCVFFFFNDTATTEIYTLSLHDALPILSPGRKSYARIEEKLPIPNLIELQLDSFSWFIDKGLRELFDEISPIKDFTDRKSTRLNSSHGYISYAVFCLKKKNTTEASNTTR